ncbi:hypothetical protein NFI96_025063 [Prochilodus magdalenae]|nr:hypothetical protein NFI96_025063 [Prochilodus magdalenae]
MAAVLVLMLMTVRAGHSEPTGFHRYGIVQACDETSADYSVVYDGEKLLYYDYKNQETVLTLPDFVDPVEPPDLSEAAIRGKNACEDALGILKVGYRNPPERLEPPWTSIYPRSDVKLNTNNTLICHVTGFFPPPVRVSWTKNGLNVTEGATLSPYYHSGDGTLSRFSTRSFTPEQGDLYGCTVEHRALEQPQTRIWDVEVQVQSSRVFPSVVCVLGVCLGMVGVAAGVLLMVMANIRYSRSTLHPAEACSPQSNVTAALLSGGTPGFTTPSLRSSPEPEPTYELGGAAFIRREENFSNAEPKTISETA